MKPYAAVAIGVLFTFAALVACSVNPNPPVPHNNDPSPLITLVDGGEDGGDPPDASEEEAGP